MRLKRHLQREGEIEQERIKKERKKKKSMDSNGGRNETGAWIGEGKKVKRKGSWIRKKGKRHRMERKGKK